MWDHWLKFNLPATLTSIEEGEDPGGVSGTNTSGDLNYGPPCPPDKEHRYFFYLYSLDTILDLKEGATKSEIKKAMQEHILQKTTLVGLYERR
ncbi:MAG: YbhB/YbcL family Raf kinase inhibitor-like protein [Candidatus Zambryskibacteria bacterium]|nr:YbhB/YbcL family Raf kinase inhibitor-like protein [Candidatus Zambryskibacteria bacterium]